MLARTVTHALVGIEPRRVEVEARVDRGAAAFAIVGLADRACQEAKERVRSGIRAAELEFPVGRITVNLAPAALRKEGAGFDLAIALAIVGASGQLSPEALEGIAAFGELALDGRVRAVAGTLVAAEGARRGRARKLMCAGECAPEVALAGVEPVPVFHLADAVAYLRGEYDPPPPDQPTHAAAAGAPDLADVRGQERGRRALEIAAAGRHNVLLAGPPGTGKTMLARRLPGVLPLLDDDEALEVTRIHSVAGVLAPGAGLVRVPPFRAPHHTASAAAVVGGGGGAGPRPGEASLAHRGVLFLDEFPEFARPVLESLRQPLEDGVVTVARVAGRATFPARFQLVATMNLCPCGARGDPAVQCTCSPERVHRYREKVSRALLDRFDLALTVPRPRGGDLAGPAGEGSDPVRSRVAEARQRLERSPPRLASEATALLTRAVERIPLSGRGRARVARVAATVAALAGADDVAAEHLAEALSYRPPKELSE